MLCNKGAVTQMEKEKNKIRDQRKSFMLLFNKMCPDWLTKMYLNLVCCSGVRAKKYN